MKTDVIWIANDGSQMDEALLQSDKVAQYKGLSHKDALQLRLLTEEMLGMMRSITGTAEGSFWIEDEEENYEFRLHLRVETYVDFDKREKLLSASSSGKNEAARGFMGKLRAFFDPLDGMPSLFNVTHDGMSADLSWSMRAYQQTLRIQMEKCAAGAAEAWDELEKSVVSHVADDVKVSIRGREVEMVIIKKTA